MSRKVEDIIGKRFGRLVVIEKTNKKSNNYTIYKCLCDCGNIVEVPNAYLKSGHTRSCGCLSKETHTKHNLSYSRLYEIHQGMKKRCYNKNSLAYKDYGGRGIVICNSWEDFENFYNWAINNGYDDNLTIDRIDVNGNYEPNNCRWVTRKQQNNNTRKNVYFTAFGKTQTISQWAKEYNIPITTFRRRILQNRPINEIFYNNNLKRLKENNNG